MPVPTLKKLQRKQKVIRKQIEWLDFALRSPSKFSSKKLYNQRVNLYTQLSYRWAQLDTQINKLLNPKKIKYEY